MEFLSLKPGRSVEGDEIPCFRSENKARNYVYLVAGTHGDEVEGVYVLQQLFDWLKDDEDVSLPLIVLPILNVDGYRASTRVNSHGVDLNRNYPTKNWSPEAREKKYFPGEKALSEPENQFLEKLFQKFPPRIIISFHSWKPMLNFNGDCEKVAQFLESYNSYPVVAEIEGHPTPGSLGEYGPEKYQAPVLTFECPLLSEDVSLRKIWEENQQGLKELLLSDLLEKK